MNELILVVDDEPKIVRLARDYLEKGNFRVLPVHDGLSALAATFPSSRSPIRMRLQP